VAASGYRYSLAFCSSPKSAGLFSKQGYERWGGQEYRTYAHTDGKCWFKGVPDELGVLVKKLRQS